MVRNEPATWAEVELYIPTFRSKDPHNCGLVQVMIGACCLIPSNSLDHSHRLVRCDLPGCQKILEVKSLPGFELEPSLLKGL